MKDSNAPIGTRRALLKAVSGSLLYASLPAAFAQQQEKRRSRPGAGWQQAKADHQRAATGKQAAAAQFRAMDVDDIEARVAHVLPRFIRAAARRTASRMAV